jgi:hypothetical protein
MSSVFPPGFYSGSTGHVSFHLTSGSKSDVLGIIIGIVILAIAITVSVYMGIRRMKNE